MRLVKFRGKWCAYWRKDGKARRISLGTEDRDLAKRRLADLEKANAAPVQTVGEIMARYMAEKTVEKPGYAARMGYAWQALEPHFGALRPDQITRELCHKYVKHRDAATGTINLELHFMQTGLKWKNKHNTAEFFIPPTSPARERHLSKAEYKRLLKGAGAPHIRLFIILALTTAGRSAAILELTWSRVDFKRGIIRLSTGEGRGKGRATVPMNKDAREALEMAAGEAITPYVVEWGGKPVKSIKKGFFRACERAGLKGVSPHVLRHTAACWLAMDGASMKEIAHLLGHKDSRITERIYIHLSPDYLRNAVKSLEV